MYVPPQDTAETLLYSITLAYNHFLFHSFSLQLLGVGSNSGGCCPTHTTGWFQAGSAINLRLGHLATELLAQRRWVGSVLLHGNEIFTLNLNEAVGQALNFAVGVLKQPSLSIYDVKLNQTRETATGWYYIVHYVQKKFAHASGHAVMIERSY